MLPDEEVSMQKIFVERRCQRTHKEPQFSFVLKNGTIIKWHPCGCLLYDLRGCEIQEDGGRRLEYAILGPKVDPPHRHRRRRHHGKDGDIDWCWECGAIREDEWVLPKE
jgi:hypothetical protein